MLLGGQGTTGILWYRGSCPGSLLAARAARRPRLGTRLGKRFAAAQISCAAERLQCDFEHHGKGSHRYPAGAGQVARGPHCRFHSRDRLLRHHDSDIPREIAGPAVRTGVLPGVVVGSREEAPGSDGVGSCGHSRRSGVSAWVGRLRSLHSCSWRCGTSPPTSGSTKPERRSPPSNARACFVNESVLWPRPRALGSPAPEQALRGRRAGRAGRGGRHWEAGGDMVAEQRDVVPGRCRRRVRDQRAAMAVGAEVETVDRVAAAEVQLGGMPEPRSTARPALRGARAYRQRLASRQP